MGLPVFVVVAEIVMQHAEEHTLATGHQTILLWLQYVDNTFTAVYQDKIDAFLNPFDKQNADFDETSATSL